MVTIDFETEKIEGALPPKPVGVAIKEYGKDPYYLAWAHPSGNNCTKEKAADILKDIFSNNEVVFHNAAFDINVAKYHLGIEYPTRLHDTLILLFLRDPHAKTLSLKPSAESILGIPPTEKDLLTDWIITNVPKATKKNAGAFIALAPVDLVGPYACADVIMTEKLFDKLKDNMGVAYNREIELLPILCENTLKGIYVDSKALERDFKHFSKVRLDAEKKIYSHLGKTFNVDSGEELASAITEAGLDIEWTYTKTGKKSTSKPNLVAGLKDPTLLDLLNYRGTLSTYLDTFMASWLEKSAGGKIHFSWNQVRNDEGSSQTGTRTGRLSSQPSMLNVPKIPPKVNPIYGLPDLPSIRGYLIPNPGELWLSRDYDGQELRVLAHYEDGKMLQMFKTNPMLDLHQMMADLMSSSLERQITRKQAKNLAFALLYGMGLSSLAAALQCSSIEAKLIKSTYFSILPGIGKLQNEIKRLWDSGKPIKTFGGRYYYKEKSREIIDKHTGLARMADFGYKGLNYLIQSSSADITKQAIINYNNTKKDGTFLVAVHDQLDISGPLSEMKILKEAMLDIPLDCPLVSSGSYGVNMLTTEEYNEI